MIVLLDIYVLYWTEKEQKVGNKSHYFILKVLKLFSSAKK